MVVSVKNLVKRYEQIIALNHFNLEVEKGDILGLIGPNGPGKTTALHCIVGLLSYDKGIIKLFDEPMYSDSYDLKRKIGIVFQNVAVFKELTVYENLCYFCGLYIEDGEKIAANVEDMMERFELKLYRDSYPDKLSQGLVRRLHIACGMVHKPELIILDEPTIAVDPASRAMILSEIKRANAEGATIIYTTHYMEEVESICNKVAIMAKGRITTMGTMDELMKKVSLGEKISVEIYSMEEEQVKRLKQLPFVYHAEYERNKLWIQTKRGKNNLIHLLEYFQKEQITFGEILASKPSLNDVFIEYTKRPDDKGGNHDVSIM